MAEDFEVLVSAKELRELQRDQEILHALYAAGVDNWEWYGDALEGIADE